MKKSVLLCSVAFCFFAVSCKKDKDQSASVAGSWRLSSWHDKQSVNDKIITDTVVSFDASYFRINFFEGDSCVAFINRETIGGKYRLSNSTIYTTPAYFSSMDMDGSSYTVTSTKLTTQKTYVSETGNNKYVTNRTLVFIKQ